MKKIISFALSAIIICSFVACGQRNQDGGFDVDPIRSVGGVYANSLDDFNDMGIILSTPENATDISYGTIDEEIALVSFTLDGFEFNLRASKVKKDDELHGIVGELEEDAIGQESDGDNYSASINVYKIKNTACIGTCTLNIIDKDTIYLTLETSSNYNLEDMLSVIDSISSECVELQT